MTQKGSHAHTQGVSGFVTHSLLRRAGILPFPAALSHTLQVPLVFYLTRSFLAPPCLLAFLTQHTQLQLPPSVPPARRGKICSHVWPLLFLRFHQNLSLNPISRIFKNISVLSAGYCYSLHFASLVLVDITVTKSHKVRQAVLRKLLLAGHNPHQ